MLTGKYNKGIPEGSRLARSDSSWILKQFRSGGRHKEVGGWDTIIERVASLAPIAASIECTMAQLAIGWCLKNDDVTTVILGATKLSQLEDNFGALKCATRISASVMEQIEAVLDNAPVVGAPIPVPKTPVDWNPNPTTNRLRAE